MILKNFNGLLHKIWPVLIPVAGVVIVWTAAKSLKERRGR